MEFLHYTNIRPPESAEAPPYMNEEQSSTFESLPVGVREAEEDMNIALTAKPEMTLDLDPQGTRS